MSVKVDVAKSEKARAEGNAAFKKGKWVDAIGGYTNAIIYNPDDPIAYSNRAQAYLKLDNYNDAERDCSTALTLAKGPNVKALYRRGLARRGLGKVEDAIADMEAVLEIEENNESVRSELDELREERKRAEAKNKIPRRPIKPPHSVISNSTSAESSIIPISSAETAQKELAHHTSALNLNGAKSDRLRTEPAPVPAISTATGSSTGADSGGGGGDGGGGGSSSLSSFASLRKARDGKKAFVGGSTITSVSAATSTASSIGNSDGNSTSDRTKSVQAKDQDVNGGKEAHHRPLTETSTGSARDAKPSSSAESAPTPFPPASISPTSLSPGAGLLLLRQLTSSPEWNYRLLSLYPAANLPRILDTLLEPDTLGLILLALLHGAQLNQEAKRKEWIKEVMVGLSGTRRWAMNVSMLSRKEKEAGQAAWQMSDGQGSWR